MSPSQASETCASASSATSAKNFHLTNAFVGCQATTISVDNIITIGSMNAPVASLGIICIASPIPPPAVLIGRIGIIGAIAAASRGTGLIVIVVIVSPYLAISRRRIVDLVVLPTAAAIRIQNRRLVNRNYCRVNCGSATVPATVASIVAIDKFRAFLVEVRPLSSTIPAPLRDGNDRNSED